MQALSRVPTPSFNPLMSSFDQALDALGVTLEVDKIRRTFQHIKIHWNTLYSDVKETDYVFTAPGLYEVRVTPNKQACINLDIPLYKGTSKEAYLALYLSGTFVLPAAHLIQQLKTPADKQRAEAEINNLSLCRGASRITQLYHSAVGEGTAHTYLELCAQGNLAQFVKKHRLTPQRIQQFIKDITKALSQLQALQLAHADLKSDNVVLTEKGGKIRAKLCDLGASYSFATPWHGFAPNPYMPPEALDSKDNVVNQTLDSWGAGCLIYEMCDGNKTPWHRAEIGSERNTIIQLVWSKLYAEENPLYKFLAGLLNPNPKERFTGTQAFAAAQQLTLENCTL